MPAIAYFNRNSGTASSVVSSTPIIAGATNLVQVVGVRVNGSQIRGGIEQVGFLWGVVTDSSQNEFWFDSKPVLFGRNACIVFPPQLQFNSYRVLFLPSPKIGQFNFQFFSGNNA